MILADVLSQKFEEVYFDEFYREIFGYGNLAPWDTDNPREDYPSDFETNQFFYTGIALEFLPEYWPQTDPTKEPTQKKKRHAIYDDLSALHELIENPEHSNNFIMLSPISYVGYRRLAKNARQMFALCIEIDDLVVRGREQEGLRMLLLFFEKGMLPCPTYLLCSGSGLHLYYVFEKPINLYPSVSKQMKKLKNDLTRKLWNKKVTRSYDNIQYESIIQNFRMLGTITKKGEKTRAFKIGEKIDIDYLNNFVPEKNRVFLNYEKYQRAAGVTPLKKAEKLWPDWYERVVLRQRAGEEPERKYWKTHEGFYYWFLKRIPFEAQFHHRYNSLLYLASIARKCQIPREEYEKDCWELQPILDFDSENPFTKRDVQDAIKAYDNDDLINATIETISGKTGIPIQRNKRYKGKQKLPRAANMKVRAIRERDIKYPNGEWRNLDGRPIGSGTAQEKVLEWRRLNPEGKKKQCKDETGLTYPTIRKWWDSEIESPKESKSILKFKDCEADLSTLDVFDDGD